ncbi:hypothetical protein B0H15DRAFT_973428 [Mycena belliarum]|uniref:Uncharacterized protein n=1 Tax=Mycena belliarum TaxID=1033014 RepID=A0AAD6XWC3_9AGAR|nr:hypothetical protein B0H15DRAFT_973428 [Mycena belliae]
MARNTVTPPGTHAHAAGECPHHIALLWPVWATAQSGPRPAHEIRSLPDPALFESPTRMLPSGQQHASSRIADRGSVHGSLGPAPREPGRQAGWQAGTGSPAAPTPTPLRCLARVLQCSAFCVLFYLLASAPARRRDVHASGVAVGHRAALPAHADDMPVTPHLAWASARPAPRPVTGAAEH